MRIVTLNDSLRDIVAMYANAAIKDSLELHIAYDEVDKGIKFKVGNGTWSPPYVTEEK